MLTIIGGYRRTAVVLIAVLFAAAFDVLVGMAPRIATFAGDLAVAAYILLAGLLLSRRNFGLLTVGLAGLWTAAKAISEVKIAHTRLPLTTLDLKIAFGNPEGLFVAIGAAWWLRTALGLMAILVLLFLLWQLKKAVVFAVREPKSFLGTMMAIACIALLLGHSMSRQIRMIAGRVEAGHFYLWEPAGVSALARRVGPLTFLAFTRELDKSDNGLFFSPSRGPGVSAYEQSTAISSYVSPAPSRSPLPNIVVVHLESTFDPNQAFRLTAPVVNTLLERTPFTQSVGRLRVNVVGGGSWVTEFEVLTGIDSRLFGYAGYYAHASLSPYARGAFPAYVRARGYDTVAYYPWPGNFYNARQAFHRYGFAEFVDVEGLGIMRHADLLQSGGSEDLDPKMAAAAIASLSRKSDARPFFAFVGFGQNHGPHPCAHFASAREFRTTLRGTDDFAINCELNEYVRRLESTARAFDRLRAFLEAREARTGRPFVILGYGDHQPHTFTGTGPFATKEYTPFRTGSSVKETLYRLDASVPGRVHCCGAAVVPTTLLPSVLSAYVARNQSDLYVPINFYLLQKCGSDAIPQNSYLAFTRDDRWGAPTRTCDGTIRRALPVIQRSGVFRSP